MIDRTPRPCEYCWFVYYSKGAFTRHINAEHWSELEKEVEEPNESTEENN